MAKFKILGNAFQVVAEITPETLANVTAYAENAATLSDEEGNQTFKVEFGNVASLSKYGATFSGITPDGKMYLMGTLTREDATPVDLSAIKREYAPIMFNLRQVEHKVAELEEIMNKFESSIDEDFEIFDEEEPIIIFEDEETETECANFCGDCKANEEDDF